MCVSSAVIEEIKRIVKQSEIIKEDDSKWPQKNKDGRQELEIRLGGDHISFEVCSASRFFEYYGSGAETDSSAIDGQDWIIG